MDAGSGKNAEGPSIAVLVPCFNEAASVATVVTAFRRHLPSARVYVYDNASTDETAERAREAGASTRAEPLRGKGNVVRRMFADVDADIYVLVDGDATYDAASAPTLVETLVERSLDMVNGRRIATDAAAYRKGHRTGNALLGTLVSLVFGTGLSDVLSGYRVFSRRFVKSFPALSMGFEIETELTVHALELRMPIAEIDTPYFPRPENSPSKLSTVRDGVRILALILTLVKEERPLAFFSAMALALAAFSLTLAWPVFTTFFETGLVPRLPTAVLATGAMLLAFLSFYAGLILETVTRGRRELKRLHYLSIPPLRS
ncbi:dolichol-phosphate mannosyltransferase [Myxococcaceae bacterium]|nr:dolichol-phosphate mannosyltransferase [Myxococcaceae bacterium]